MKIKQSLEFPESNTDVPAVLHPRWVQILSSRQLALTITRIKRLKRARSPSRTGHGGAE